MQKTTDIVRGLAAPVVESKDCALWDVEYVKEGGRQVLRVFIERPGGVVSIDDCEAVSRALDPLLDEKDPIAESYVLEVSSAGLERALKRPEHFEASMGKRVEVSLYSPQNGVKKFAGELSGFDGGTLTIDTGDGAVSFDMKTVSRVKWLFEF